MKKTAETTDNLIGNTISDKVTKLVIVSLHNVSESVTIETKMLDLIKKYWNKNISSEKENKNINNEILI